MAKMWSVTSNYYRFASGIILLYDVTRRVGLLAFFSSLLTTIIAYRKESFDHVSKWIAEARRMGAMHAMFLLVGNKTDLSAQREVTEQEGKVCHRSFTLETLHTISTPPPTTPMSHTL